MATINDRITKLEDAFITLAEGQRGIVTVLTALADGQKALADGQREIVTVLTALADGQKALAEGQQTLIEGQKAIIATLQDHSIELKLIREHLG